MYCGDDVGAVVADIGSLYAKFGYAGDDTPKWVEPSCAAAEDALGRLRVLLAGQEPGTEPGKGRARTEHVQRVSYTIVRRSCLSAIASDNNCKRVEGTGSDTTCLLTCTDSSPTSNHFQK